MRVVEGLTDETTKNDDDGSHNDDDVGDGRRGGERRNLVLYFKLAARGTSQQSIRSFKKIRC